MTTLAIKQASLALLLALPGLAAQAVDAYSLSAGYGDRVSQLKTSMIWHWDKRWFTEGDWHLTGYWEANASLMLAHASGGNTFFEAGITPVFRLRPNASGSTQPYWEAGIGPHLVSNSEVDPDRDLGSPLLMAELLGFGVTFGDKTRYDVGYRLQHLSNWGFKDPDNGLTLHEVRLTYLY
jgi:hypothetical protein